MKTSTLRVLGISLALQLVWCGSLMGQAAPTAPKAGDSLNTVLAASTGQEERPLRGSHSDDTFVIGDDDVLSINVWKDQDLTKQVTVRTDGKISLPLIGEIQAAGRTPLQLETDIADRLKSYMNDPQVTVIVQEIHSLKFNILGEVTKPGSYPLTAGTTIVDAIAIAGGFKDFAKKKGTYVLRPGATGAETRYEFNYQDFIKGKNVKQNILLKPHDTIVVP